MAGTLEPKDVSAILTAWGDGRPGGRQRADWNRLPGTSPARRALPARTNAADNTLQPTALVHELYLKLFSTEPVLLHDREHFLAVAARQLRHIVVDYAEKQERAEAGRGARHDFSRCGARTGDPGGWPGDRT